MGFSSVAAWVAACQETQLPMWEVILRQDLDQDTPEARAASLKQMEHMWEVMKNSTGAGSGAPTYEFSNAFTGKLNGKGHSITGISWTCDMSKNNVYGLFGAADGAKISNLVIGAKGDAITLTGTPDITPSVAGVVGYAENTTIANVTNNVSIILEG